jgi:hypothetical protein
MERVSFITTEDGDDLIVAFAIAVGHSGDIVSLTLLRTPKYERFLPPEERGVSITRENRPETDEDMLQQVEWRTDSALLTTRQGRRYHLDLHPVDAQETGEAERILRKMSADGAFDMT